MSAPNADRDTPQSLSRLTGCREDDDEKAENGQQVGDLRKEEKPQERGENYVRIVVEGDCPRLRKSIGGGDAELSHCGPRPRAEHDDDLRESHWGKVHKHERHRPETGEGAEEKDDKRAVHFLAAKFMHAHIGEPCAESAQESARGGEEGIAAEARLHDEHRAEEGGEEAGYLPPGGLFAQKQPREEDGKKRRRLVESHRLAYGDSRERIEVGEDADESEHAAHDESAPRPHGRWQAARSRRQAGPAFREHRERDRKRYRIAEEALLEA